MSCLADSVHRLWPGHAVRTVAALCCAAFMAACGEHDFFPESASPPACIASAEQFGCLQQRPGPAIGQTIAVNTHYAPQVDPAALALLRAAGVRTLRNDLTWASIERTPGVYDFTSTGYDALVAAAEQEGLRFLFILDYGNRLYGPARAVVSDSGRAAFAAFAAAAAAHYGGRGHRWEIWNEPNGPQYWGGSGFRPDPEMYARLVAATVPALRGADPSGTILAGSVFYGIPDVIETIGGVGGLKFLQRLAETGVLSQVDGVTVHFYRAEAPETVTPDVLQLRALFADAGAAVDVWSGEWGYSTYDQNAPQTGLNYIPAVSLDRQASYVARMLLINSLLDVPLSVYYQDRDPAHPDPGNIEDHWGLLRDDLSPKPSYNALAALNRLVGDFPRLGTLLLADGQHGVVFAGHAGLVTTLWTEDQASWRIRPAHAGAQLFDRDGNDVTSRYLQPDGTIIIALAADDGPVYLTGGFQIAPVTGG